MNDGQEWLLVLPEAVLWFGLVAGLFSVAWPPGAACYDCHSAGPHVQRQIAVAVYLAQSVLCIAALIVTYMVN